MEKSSAATFPEDLTKYTKTCLIAGYTRRVNCNIPSEIIALFYDYYDISKYWKINPELLSKMKQATNFQTFDSEGIKYEFNGTMIEWYSQVTPNEMGHFRYYIYFRSLPSNVKSIVAICKLSLKGSKSDHHNNGNNDMNIIRMMKRAKNFTNEKNYTGSNLGLSLKHIESLEYKSLEFETYIDFIAVEYEPQIKSYQFYDEKIEIDDEIEFEWKVDETMLKEWKKAEPGKAFYSKTFGKGGNWCMWIEPNGDDWQRKGVILGINLLRVTDGIKYNVACNYKLTMICDGKEISFQEPAEFRMDSKFWYWAPEKSYSNQDFQNVSQVQIYLKIWDIKLKEKQ